jgi:hypothetical protein
LYGVEQLASQLGLGFENVGMLPPTVRARGLLDGARVELISNHADSFVRGWLATELDLGLKVTAQVPFSVRLRGWIDVGEGSWDAEIDARCDEPDRGRALLGRELRRLIERVNVEDPTFVIDDRRVQFRVWPPHFEAGLRRAVEVCHLFESARRDVPAPSALAPHAEAWRTLSRDRLLQHEPTPLRVWGTTEGVAVTGVTRRRREGLHGIDLVLEDQDPSLWPELTLRRETVGDKVRAAFGAGDLRTGDDAFDRAFRVEAKDAGWALRVLDPPARAALLAATGSFARVGLTGFRLFLSGDSTEVAPDALARALGWMTTLRESVARAADASQGPYR